MSLFVAMAATDIILWINGSGHGGRTMRCGFTTEEPTTVFLIIFIFNFLCFRMTTMKTFVHQFKPKQTT